MQSELGENLTDQYSGYAIYLPSLQSGYAKLPYADQASVRNGNLPNGFNPNNS